MTEEVEDDRRSRHDHAREVFERLGLNPRLPSTCAVWEKGRLVVEHVHVDERFTYFTETDRWTPDGENIYTCEGPKHFARRHAGAGTWYVIRGETYPVRDELKERGLIWDREREEWGTNDEETFREAVREVGASLCGEHEAVREGTTEAEGEPLLVTGNTWNARHALRAVGMNWEPDAEVYWTRDRNVWERVREAVPTERTGERELTVDEDLAPWNVDERIDWSRLPGDPPERSPRR